MAPLLINAPFQNGKFEFFWRKDRFFSECSRELFTFWRFFFTTLRSPSSSLSLLIPIRNFSEKKGKYVDIRKFHFFSWLQDINSFDVSIQFWIWISSSGNCMQNEVIKVYSISHQKNVALCKCVLIKCYKTTGSTWMCSKVKTSRQILTLISIESKLCGWFLFVIQKICAYIVVWLFRSLYLSIARTQMEIIRTFDDMPYVPKSISSFFLSVHFVALCISVGFRANVNNKWN